MVEAPESPHSIALRARTVLLAADGMSNVAVADKGTVHEATVVKWRKWFLARRLDGLIDEPRPRGAAHDQRCGRRGGRGAHVGGQAGRRDALVDA